MNETLDQNIVKFRSLFERMEKSMNGQRQHPLHDIRRRANDRLQELRFPTRRDEDWKYTPVTRIVTTDYELSTRQDIQEEDIQPFLIPELDAFRLVFVDGLLNEALSQEKELPKGVTLRSMAAAMDDDTFRPMVEAQLNKIAEESEDPFQVMNVALATEGVFIHVPRNVAVEKPIHFLYINTTRPAPYTAHPQRLLVLDESSELRMVDSFHALNPADSVYFNNVLNLGLLAQNAHLKHYKLQDESREAFQINNTSIYQDGSSTYTNHAIDLGGRLVRNNLNAIHQGEGINSNFYGVFHGKDSQHIDTHSFIDHAIPNCESSELYKGILTDKARGVFNGKVMVRRDAQKTNAFQQNATLVLSDKAVMDSKPELEIYADDVKCSHGATIGQLDEDSVFYLRSRGFNDQQARIALQNAFLLEVIEHIQVEPVRAKAEAMLLAKFGE